MAKLKAVPRSQVHRDSVETAPSDMAAYLQGVLGTKLVARIVGVNDSKTITRWAKGERAPRDDNEQRLRDTYLVFRTLTEAESQYTIRAWFVGLNPVLGDESPAMALREGRTREVLLAAKAFLADG
jgi:hypothetical protein